jgi:hypothetical protein
MDVARAEGSHRRHPFQIHPSLIWVYYLFHTGLCSEDGTSLNYKTTNMHCHNLRKQHVSQSREGTVQVLNSVRLNESRMGKTSDCRVVTSLTEQSTLLYKGRVGFKPPNILTGSTTIPGPWPSLQPMSILLRHLPFATVGSRKSFSVLSSHSNWGLPDFLAPS